MPIVDLLEAAELVVSHALDKVSLRENAEGVDSKSSIILAHIDKHTFLVRQLLVVVHA